MSPLILGLTLLVWLILVIVAIRYWYISLITVTLVLVCTAIYIVILLLLGFWNIIWYPIELISIFIIFALLIRGWLVQPQYLKEQSIAKFIQSIVNYIKWTLYAIGGLLIASILWVVGFSIYYLVTSIGR